jgi:hypothetical protein
LTANQFAVSDFIPDLKMRGFHPPAFSCEIKRLSSHENFSSSSHLASLALTH